MIVARVRTPVVLADLVDLLDTGHHRLRGFGLVLGAYELAAAQLELEHGTELVGGALSLWAVWCFNLGNHDATAEERANPDDAIFGTVPEREVLAGGETLERHVRHAYVDAADGAEGYWSCLLDGFTEAYDALSSSSPGAFAAALKSRHYYTEDEAVYARSLGRLAAERAAARTAA